jgi:hypothetical protein
MSCAKCGEEFKQGQEFVSADCGLVNSIGKDGTEYDVANMRTWHKKCAPKFLLKQLGLTKKVKPKK